MIFPTLRLRRALAILVPALALSLAAAGPAAAEEPAFEPAQEDAIRELVRDYLLDNPEVLVEALELYRFQQNQVQERRKQEALIAHRKALEEDPDAPVLGNPDGDVVIVEFFDYRCPYCKKAADTVLDVVQADGNIRLVMKEYPILGPDSLYASQAALAAREQGMYEAFHFALMDTPGELDEARILAVARSVGLDTDQLKADLTSAEVDGAIRRNYELAEALDIRGTPAFVVGSTLVPGAIDRDSLLALIAKARES